MKQNSRHTNIYYVKCATNGKKCRQYEENMPVYKHIITPFDICLRTPGVTSDLCVQNRALR